MDLSNYLDPSIITSLQAGGYVIMLALMIAEGPIVTFIAGFLASLGIFDIWMVLFLAWIGDILGDLIFYSIGRFGFKIFKKETTSSKVGSGFIAKLDHLIHENLALALLIIKFTPYAPPVGLTYIGKLQIPFRKYILYSAILCIPIPLIAGQIGYHIGRMNTLIQNYSGATLIFSLALSLGTIAIAMLSIYFLRKKSKSILKAETLIVEKIEKNTTSAE